MNRSHKIGTRAAVAGLAATLSVFATGIAGSLASSPSAPDRLADLRSELTALAPSIDSSVSYVYFLDSKTGRLQVDTDGPTDYFARLVNQYPDLLDVESARVELASGRLADTSPFWGGAAINGDTHLCTSGYIVKNSTKRFMVTAGHCFALNETIHAGRSGGEWMGTVTQRDYPDYEAELISGGSYGTRIYNGVLGDDTSNIPVLGRIIDIAGTTGYCRTGQTSGRSCGWSLDDTFATFCYQGSCTYYVNAYHGGQSPQGGDSGGPIYRPVSGGALVAGDIIGYSCILFYCTYFGEKVGPVLEHWSVSLACSSYPCRFE